MTTKFLKDARAAPPRREVSRLNLAIPIETRGRLEKLREDTGVANITAVICNAIRFYEFYIEQQQEGRELLVRGKGEAPMLVKFFTT